MSRIAPGAISSDETSPSAAALPQAELALLPSYTLASLPTAGTAGRLARVTDDIRGIWIDTGTQWISRTGHANIQDFGASPTATAAANLTAIQAAIDAATATGTRPGSVLVPPVNGQYDVDNVISGRSDLTFFGLGYGSHIRMTADPPIRTFQTNDGDRITVYGLRFSGSDADGAVSSAGRGAVHITENSERTIVVQNYFDAPATTAITNEGIRSLIAHNIIENPKEHGIYLSGSGTAIGQDNVVTANVIVNAGVSGINTGTTGIKMSDAPGNIVSHNRIIGGKDHGILIEGASNGTEISHNTVSGTSDIPVRVISTITGQASLIDNTILDAPANVDALLIQGGTALTIRGNNIRRATTGGAGIRVTGTGGRLDISENTFIANVAGLTAFDLAGGDDHIVQDNRFLSGSATPDTGIIVRAGVDNCRLIDNFSQATTRYSDSGTGTFIRDTLHATATLDFDLSASASQDLTMTVTGAAVGDTVSLGVPNASVEADTLFWAWVSSADTVTVRAMRIAGTPDPAGGTFRVEVGRH